MRLWSLRPKYLDSQGLVALWREGLLAQAVLRGKTRGYRNAVYSALRAGRARFCDLVRLELWNGIGGDRERKWLRELEQTVESDHPHHRQYLPPA